MFFNSTTDPVSFCDIHQNDESELLNVNNGNVFILGEAYHAFVAKDISRAFVTGEFESKSIKDSLDHVLSMSPSELLALKKWKDFYLENYDLKGKMIGR